jgi:hypothetical protein
MSRGLGKRELEILDHLKATGGFYLTDTRYKAYVKKYGELAVELDALHPSILSGIVKEDIEGVIDVDLFKEQKAMEQNDMTKIKGLRVEVMDFINQKVNGLTCQTQ